MKVAMFGASGAVGSRILREANDRGHQVTAVVRDLKRSPASASASVLGDVTDAESIAAAVEGHDAVISAVGGPTDSGPVVIPAARALVAGLSRAGVDRLLVVGGAGSLITPAGVAVYDSPEFPEEWKPQSKAQGAALAIYRESGDALRWTFLSPADQIEPGERTEQFVLGSDHLIVDDQGRSRISMEDFAVALIDELERPRHVRRRFTLGYA